MHEVCLIGDLCQWPINTKGEISIWLCVKDFPQHYFARSGNREFRSVILPAGSVTQHHSNPPEPFPHNDEPRSSWSGLTTIMRKGVPTWESLHRLSEQAPPMPLPLPNLDTKSSAPGPAPPCAPFMTPAEPPPCCAYARSGNELPKLRTTSGSPSEPAAAGLAGGCKGGGRVAGTLTPPEADCMVV